MCGLRPSAVDDSGGDVLDGPVVDQPQRLHEFDGSGEPGGAQHVGHLEREIEALAGVEPRVAHGLIAVVELAVEDLVGAADALGDVVAGQLDVDAAGPCALGLVGRDEAVGSRRRCDRSRGSCGRSTM